MPSKILRMLCLAHHFQDIQLLICVVLSIRSLIFYLLYSLWTVLIIRFVFYDLSGLIDNKMEK